MPSGLVHQTSKIGLKLLELLMEELNRKTLGYLNCGIFVKHESHVHILRLVKSTETIS